MTIPTLATFELAIVSGLAMGCVYGLVAIAYNLVLAASGVFNMATGAVITIGVVMSYVLGQRLNWKVYAVIGGIIAVGAVTGSLAELLGVRRLLAGARSVSHDTMVSTLGLGLVGEALVALLFGNDIYPVPSYVSANSVEVGGVPIPPLYFVMPAVLLIVAVGLELLLRRTEFGVVTRAVIADPEGASLVGISVATVVQWSFVAAGIMAAVSGFLAAPLLSASAGIGESVTVYAFAAAAIGGFGSFRGGVVGGLIVGLVGSGLTPAFFNSNWSLPLLYVIVVPMLFFRPKGLFGRAGQFGSEGERRV
jgi:branched-chain amino acid transport system permease protein